MKQHDPATYREMNVPFASTAEANEVCNRFLNELAELRKKHKLPNVYTIVQGTALDSSGAEGEFMCSFRIGDPLMSLPMTAYAFGFEKKEQQETLARMLAGRE